MRYRTVLCGAVLYYAVRWDAVRCGTIRCPTVRRFAVGCGAVYPLSDTVRVGSGVSGVGDPTVGASLPQHGT